MGLRQGHDGNADSFWIYSDVGSRILANVDGEAWSWHRARATLHIADGSHQLTVINREDGAEIDALLLTRDADYRPSDGDITHVFPTGHSATTTLVPLIADRDGQAHSGSIDIGTDQYVDSPVVRSLVGPTSLKTPPR